ncbi:hypothetical protein [Methylosinus sp. KRF6]|uniref:hypothetical protein n=1 Tax=Methylosinus sp. KRF6 TaxID=2846853 RepID=UPI001C0BA4F7|nr:hypothetical protein [Methylosinus sp. KRF6]MBU3888565.1 hypothetical protein [Methylosinus sp. KRF6]
MKPLISKPANKMQQVFNELCEKGGGAGGGPARPKVLELLFSGGQSLNKLAYEETANHFAELAGANPWHICFAIALSWGHLAKLELDFTIATVKTLETWQSSDLRAACSFHLERGPAPIEQSLTGARILFEKVTLPEQLPASLEGLGRAQERWLSPVLNPKTRPPYIGAWNSTAMFMVALFAQPSLAATHKKGSPALPPGGPIRMGLHYLHQAKVISAGPSGSELDDGSFEPGVIYADNGLFHELCAQRPDWSLIDVHSGLYMLGTRDRRSAEWDM